MHGMSKDQSGQRSACREDCQMKVVQGNIIISIRENMRDRFVVFANCCGGSER